MEYGWIRTLLRLSLACLVLGLFAANHASAQTITISNRAVYTTYNPPLPGGTAYYVLNSNGDIMTSNPHDTYGSDTGDWLSPKINMSNYQVRATSNTCNGPPVNTWLPLSGGQYWYVTATGPAPQSKVCYFTIEISATANPSVILGTANIMLNAYY